MKNRISRRIMIVVLGGAFAGGSIAVAQTNVEVMGGIQFNFSTPGARSLALGGAFIGLADDATAAFSNPAGLTQLIDMEFSLETRPTDFTHEFNERGHAFEDPTGIGVDTVSGLQAAESSSRVAGASFLSFVYPRRPWVIAGYRHESANFETEIQTQGAFFRRSDNGLTTRFFPMMGDLDLEILAYGVSGAFALSDSFSVGVGLAYYEFELGSLTRRFEIPFPNPSSPDTTPGGDFGPPDYSDSNLVLFEEQFGNDDDMAVNVGFRWTIGKLWSLGGAYRQGPDFGFKVVSSNTYGDSVEFSPRFSVPDVLGLGVAYRPTDALTASFEYDHVKYSSLTEDTAAVLEQGCSASLSAEDADELHVGLEYVFTNSSLLPAVRVGGWHDPDHQVAFRGSGDSVCDQIGSILFPRGSDNFHYTAGLGLVVGKNVKIDMAADLSDLVDTISISGVLTF